jgi:hypothetical protein
MQYYIAAVSIIVAFGLVVLPLVCLNLASASRFVVGGAGPVLERSSPPTSANNSVLPNLNVHNGTLITINGTARAMQNQSNSSIGFGSNATVTRPSTNTSAAKFDPSLNNFVDHPH